MTRFEHLSIIVLKFTIWDAYLIIVHFSIPAPLIWWFQIEPFKTGAVAPEVNKLKVGKLDIKEEEKSKDEVAHGWKWMKMEKWVELGNSNNSGHTWEKGMKVDKS